MEKLSGAAGAGPEGVPPTDIHPNQLATEGARIALERVRQGEEMPDLLELKRLAAARIIDARLAIAQRQAVEAAARALVL